MITLTFILTALVVLTSWDAEADDNQSLVPVPTNDEPAITLNR